MEKKVAALYVQPDGCYQNLSHVDPWDEKRDARTYVGTLPIVAHPPCQRWGNMANLVYSITGKDIHRPGNDSGCFAAALSAVKRNGGVIEHPAFSRAFQTYGLKKPSNKVIGWQQMSSNEWVCNVWQSAYGYKANKATWLYYHSPIGQPPFELQWERPNGSHQVGGQVSKARKVSGKSYKPSLSKKEADATPPLFRDTLIALAVWSVTPNQPTV